MVRAVILDTSNLHISPKNIFILKRNISHFIIRNSDPWATSDFRVAVGGVGWGRPKGRHQGGELGERMLHPVGVWW